MSNTTNATGPQPESDIATLLTEKGRPEKVIPLHLRGHLQAEWDELKAQFDAGPGVDDRAMMTERAAKRRIAEQMAAVEAQMRAGTVRFRLRALPRRRTPGMPPDQVVWRELVERHPPRKDANGKVDQRDADTGVNVDTLFEELVRVSVVDPALTGEQWDQLDAKLTDAQWERLWLAAWQLNRRDVDVPFSRAASIVRSFDAASRRQNDSASPLSGSTVGSPSTSPSTSTTATDG